MGWKRDGKFLKKELICKLQRRMGLQECSASKISYSYWLYNERVASLYMQPARQHLRPSSII